MKVAKYREYGNDFDWIDNSTHWSLIAVCLCLLTVAVRCIQCQLMFDAIKCNPIDNPRDIYSIHYFLFFMLYGLCTGYTCWDNRVDPLPSRRQNRSMRKYYQIQQVRQILDEGLTAGDNCQIDIITVLSQHESCQV